MAPTKRVTGLQRQVLSLYKRSLLMVASKPLVRSPSLLLAGLQAHPSERKRDLHGSNSYLITFSIPPSVGD
jgi:hypothetical protein